MSLSVTCRIGARAREELDPIRPRHGEAAVSAGYGELRRAVDGRGREHGEVQQVVAARVGVSGVVWRDAIGRVDLRACGQEIDAETTIVRDGILGQHNSGAEAVDCDARPAPAVDRIVGHGHPVRSPDPDAALGAVRAVVRDDVVRHDAGAADGVEFDSGRASRQPLTVRNGVRGEGDVRAEQSRAIVAAAGDHIVRDLRAGTECIGEANAVAVVVDESVVGDEVVVGGACDRDPADRTTRPAIVGEIVLRNRVVVAAPRAAVDDNAGAGDTGRPVDEALNAQSGDGAIAGLQHKPAGLGPRSRSVEHDHRRSSRVTGLRPGVDDDRVGEHG